MPQPQWSATLPGAPRPAYLDVRDHLWLAALLDEYRRFEGRRSAELAVQLRDPLRVRCPADRLRRARTVMDTIVRPVTSSLVPPAKVREAVFVAAAARDPSPQVIAATAKALDCSAAQLQAALLADLPGEKLIPPLPPQLHPAELALRVNLALVQALLRRATQLRVAVWGNARDIVRYAHLRGLLCVVRAGDTVADAPAAWLEISGPMSLFRRTRLYGNALAGLVPRMCWCDRFEVHAECMFGDEIRSVRIGSGDPIFPAEQPKPFDSRLEQRFARDFARAAPDWDVVREPMPWQSVVISSSPTLRSFIDDIPRVAPCSRSSASGLRPISQTSSLWCGAQGAMT
jgi:predicted nuclease of restriction endonuclease-like RecB superfamily